MLKPSRYLVYSLSAIMASALAVQPLLAATFFTEDEFDKAAGSTTVIDFEKIAPEGGTALVGNPTDPAEFSGVTFGGSGGKEGLYVASNSLFSASGSDVLVDQDGRNGEIYMLLPKETYSVGAYFYSGTGTPVIVAGPDGDFEVKSGSFFGFVDEKPITEIKFYSNDPQGSEAVYMDNFKFGTLAIEGVPEPSSWLSLGILGVCGLALGLRKKTAQI